jgi:hypothetical protein
MRVASSNEVWKWEKTCNKFHPIPISFLHRTEKKEIVSECTIFSDAWSLVVNFHTLSPFSPSKMQQNWAKNPKITRANQASNNKSKLNHVDVRVYKNSTIAD